jgi:hypothetical protein
MKSKGLTLFLCLTMGWFGAHRFYVGKVGTGLMQMLTAGGFLIWWFIDFVLILTGKFTDSNGIVVGEHPPLPVVFSTTAIDTSGHGSPLPSMQTSAPVQRKKTSFWSIVWKIIRLPLILVFGNWKKCLHCGCEVGFLKEYCVPCRRAGWAPRR